MVWEFDEAHQRWLPVAELALPGDKGDQVYVVAWAPNIGREPRGFGFVPYVAPNDAAEVNYQMDGQVFHGREQTVVFAEETRKKPAEMRARER
ncbi:hypothetical protein IFM89_024856 [Coptis chinensis]|uniref:Uncharacterized protein n=1 Tax=Coptis chinensis TaxID=261450 RepID=A0A835HPB9_9MAGN|nr:hypothetical protein IFM89_024856 [Coptis chinensis]